ncbi:MAG: aminotransferase class I/II-fold pyridoxal phosphate-dependent enzyme, partial [Lachnospiraceae bacterium]|nr:aminotransferase class I/II-fold pyridoxal phosphate-dependent enzyme [Lachnospiraceae bacterium]
MKLNDFELEVYFGKYEFTAPYLLAQSDCEAMPAGELLALEPGAEEGFMAQHLGYTEDHGDPELRKMIAELYPGRSAEDVLVLSGAEEGIFILLNVLLDAGDHAIVMYPNYPSAYEVIKAIPGCTYSEWKVRDDGEKWAIDFDELVSLIKPETKLIAVNSPNNPTGYTFSDEELERLCGICREKGIYLFCDEVYQGLERDGKRRVSAASLYDKALSLNVMSKAYGLAGLRIGWAVCADRELIEKMVKFRHYTSICNSAPSEYLTKVALKHGDELLARSKGIIAENLEAAQAFFDKFSDVF